MFPTALNSAIPSVADFNVHRFPADRAVLVDDVSGSGDDGTGRSEGDSSDGDADNGGGSHCLRQSPDL